MRGQCTYFSAMLFSPPGRRGVPEPSEHVDRTLLLAALALDAYFSLVVSGDTLARRKPDPMPLLHAAEHFSVFPADALLIGDSANDVKAARAAGFRIICVSYGYNHGEDVRTSERDAVVDSLAEIPEILQCRDRANAKN